MSTSTTTPSTAPPQPRSTSHSRTRTGTIPSRPTTPLRPPSRTSLRTSQTTPTASGQHANTSSSADHILNTLESSFSELSDGMADLEANMMHLQLLHESLSRFNETFGAFLYGMNMTAFCVDFPEAPIGQSFMRHQKELERERDLGERAGERGGDGMTEATFLTSDTSFVNDPPPTVSTAASSGTGRGVSRGATGGRGTAPGRGRAATSGIARGRGTRGVRGAAGAGGRSGSGIARGAGRGRGVK